MKNLSQVLVAVALTLFLHLVALLVMLFVDYREAPSNVRFIEVDMIEEPIDLVEPKTLEELIEERVNEQISNLMANANSEQSTEKRSFSQAAEERMQEQVEQNLRDLEQSVLNELEDQRGEVDTVRQDQPEEVIQPNKEDYEWFNSSYNGAVTASVDVPGREPLKIHIPGYLCQGGGTVVMNVVVNVNGEVISAQINTQKSRVSDACLVEEASRSALKSLFFAKSAASKRSEGTITYRFVPQ